MTKRKAKDSKKENSQSVQSKVWKADERQCVCVCSLIVWELGCSRPPERQRGGSGEERFQRAGKVQLLAIRSLWLQLTKSMLYFVFVIVFCCCICIFPLRCEQAGHKKCDRACGSRRAAIICRNLWQQVAQQPLTTHVSSHPSSHTPWKLLKTLENTRI